MSCNPSPKKFICIVSGNIQVTNPKQAPATITIDAQFPIFKALCTSASFASFEEILTSKVPISEIIIPTPAIDIGNKMGPIPPKASSIAPPISFIT